MQNLTPELVATIQSYMKGSRLVKFNESVQVINDSLQAGGWVSRGSVKANRGFYQGCGVKTYHSRSEPSIESDQDYRLYMCLTYGSPVDELGNAVDRLFVKTNKLTDKLVMNPKKHPREFVEAWVALCDEKADAIELLNSFRTLPVVTEIGLSHKVTITLKDMNLNIHLPSIRLANIGRRMVYGFLRDGSPLLDRRGKHMLVPEYFVDWTPGTQMGRSRFSYGCKCEACGKSIPSGRFVAIEADDMNSGDHIGLWIGQDCARNIFGVKDEGMDRV